MQVTTPIWLGMGIPVKVLPFKKALTLGSLNSPHLNIELLTLKPIFAPAMTQEQLKTLRERVSVLRRFL